jgi:hypothetical protein
MDFRNKRTQADEKKVLPVPTATRIRGLTKKKLTGTGKTAIQVKKYAPVV